MTIASLARIPVVDVRHGGPVRHAAEGRARARALRDECVDWLPRLAAGLLPVDGAKFDGKDVVLDNGLKLRDQGMSRLAVVFKIHTE